MGEDFDNHRRIFDGGPSTRLRTGDALQAAAPQFGQCSMSMSKTRLSSLAQLRRAGAPARDRMRARLLALAAWGRFHGDSRKRERKTPGAEHKSTIDGRPADVRLRPGDTDPRAITRSFASVPRFANYRVSPSPEIPVSQRFPSLYNLELLVQQLLEIRSRRSIVAPIILNVLNDWNVWN